MLIVVCGLQGTGKSRVAKLLSQKLNARLLSTDVLRKKQEYHFKAKMATYDLLFNLAEEYLKKKKDVILDATFYRKDLREKAKELAKKFNTKFYLIEVTCDEKILRERIEKRGTSANYIVYLKYKKIWQPILEKHIMIDNSKNLKNLGSQIENLYSRLTRGGQNNPGKSSG